MKSWHEITIYDFITLLYIFLFDYFMNQLLCSLVTVIRIEHAMFMNFPYILMENII